MKDVSGETALEFALDDLPFFLPEKPTYNRLINFAYYTFFSA